MVRAGCAHFASCVCEASETEYYDDGWPSDLTGWVYPASSTAFVMQEINTKKFGNAYSGSAVKGNSDDLTTGDGFSRASQMQYKQLK